MSPSYTKIPVGVSPSAYSEPSLPCNRGTEEAIKFILLITIQLFTYHIISSQKLIIRALHIHSCLSVLEPCLLFEITLISYTKVIDFM